VGSFEVRSRQSRLYAASSVLACFGEALVCINSRQATFFLPDNRPGEEGNGEGFIYTLFGEIFEERSTSLTVVL